MARTLRAEPSCCGLPSAFRPALTRLAIKRLQRAAVPASKLACPSAADPQHVREQIMMEIQGKRLQVENVVLDMPHPVLDARQIGQRIVVIFDYMDYPRWRQA